MITSNRITCIKPIVHMGVYPPPASEACGLCWGFHREHLPIIEGFRGHRGTCMRQGCEGVVTMGFDVATMNVIPDNCSCCQCGKFYKYCDKILDSDELQELSLKLWREKGDGDIG